MKNFSHFDVIIFTHGKEHDLLTFIQQYCFAITQTITKKNVFLIQSLEDLLVFCGSLS